jgi:hypothetical protein
MEGVSPESLAELATRLGRPGVALTQSRLLLAAQPQNADALVLSLLAAALGGDVTLGQTLSYRPVSTRRPAPERATILSDLIRWHVGDDEARQWDEAYRRASEPPAPE